MRRGSPLFVLLALAFPAFALADEPVAENGVTAARLELTATELEVLLTTRRRSGPPIVHTSRGFVKIWLPDTSADVFLEPSADGHLVRWAKVRPGMSGTTLLTLRLGDGRRLAPEDVHVGVADDGVRVAIDRTVLPALPPPPVVAPEAPAPIVTAVAPAAQAAEPAAAVDAPPAAPVVTSTAPAAPTAAPVVTSTAPVAAPAAPAAAPVATSTAPTEAEASAPPTDAPEADERLTTSSRRGGPPPVPMTALAEGKGLGMGMLLTLTVLLAAAYGLIKILQRRRAGPGAAADIQIIGAKRLGTRHQIVVVRALGEDHLLSIHGSNTELIASSPISASTPEPAPAKRPAPPQPETAKLPATGFFARLQQNLGRPQFDVADHDAPPPEDRPLSAVLPLRPATSARAHRPAAEPQHFASADAPDSDRPEESSVAGIIRLRERFGR